MKLSPLWGVILLTQTLKETFKEREMKITLLFPLTLLMFMLAQPAFTQAPSPKPSVWLVGSWGGGDAKFAEESYSLAGLGLQVHFPHHVIILRAERGWDDFEELNTMYRSQEYRGMWGYSKPYDNHRLYIATGLSYSKHSNRELVSQKAAQASPENIQDWSFLGVPIEAGLQIKLIEKLALGAAASINLNEVNSYISYQVNVQYRLFN